VDEEEVVKVLDFGIAKDTALPAVGEVTKTGELMGSPHYMSPEQVRGSKDVDHRSDLWALAVVTFRAITGQLPFDGAVIGAVIGQILADPIPVATTVSPDLPPEVDAFFSRGFARDPAQRFQSARDLAEAFAVIASAAPALEGPTRVRMPSLPAIDAAFDAATAPVSQPPSLFPGPVSGGTGGPVAHSARPPERRTSRAWWGAAAAGGVLGVLLGGGAFVLSRRPPPPVTMGPQAAPNPTPAEPASASAAPQALPATSVSPPIASAPPSASASAAPAKSAKPPRPPSPPPPPAAATKKPSWGF
jgi:serine/threonine-protein kinase